MLVLGTLVRRESFLGTFVPDMDWVLLALILKEVRQHPKDSAWQPVDRHRAGHPPHEEDLLCGPLIRVHVF